MNKILSEITTKIFDEIEKDKTKRLSYSKNNYEVFYNPELELINHYYYGHKIFSINFKTKIKKYLNYNSRLTKAQINYLFKFYEKFDFIIEEIKL